jgi:AraC-like DNA-binding protein
MARNVLPYLKSKVHQISVRLLVPLIDELNDRGVDTQELLQRNGTTLAVVLSVPYRIPVATATSIWSDARDATGDAALGLEVGRETDPRVWELFGYLLGTSMNLREALARNQRYSRLLDEGHTYDVLVDDRHVTVRSVPRAGVRRPAVMAENALSALASVFSRISARPVSPIGVAFRHAASAAPSDYETAFGVGAAFHQIHDELVYPRSVLDVPCRRADPILGSVLERNAQEYLELIPTNEKLSDKVRAIVHSMLPDAVPTEIDAARMLCMSARTLRRYLSSEHTTYREICESLRREMALHDLRNNVRTIEDVAESLGFASASSFHQAFRRWTGVTPAAYKRQNRAAD